VNVARLTAGTKPVLVLTLSIIGTLLGTQSTHAQAVSADPLNVDPNGYNTGTLEYAIIFSAPISFPGFSAPGHPAAPSFKVQNGVGIASSRSGPNNGGLDFYTPGATGAPVFSGATAQIQVSITPGGDVGIGTQSPKAPLEIDRSGYAQINLNSTTGRNWALMSTGSNVINASDFQIYDLTANASRLQLDSNGMLTVKTVKIEGGADLAEPFLVRDDRPKPGTILVIDPRHPGDLKVSSAAYDRGVAGVVSGANGVHSALTLTQFADAEAQDQAAFHRDVALSGRVYALADATASAIQPGDLLTTALTPGYCMKATNSTRARGAVLGKAMTSLSGGKGRSFPAAESSATRSMKILMACTRFTFMAHHPHALNLQCPA
jgi:hypothetical protein